MSNYELLVLAALVLLLAGAWRLSVSKLGREFTKRWKATSSFQYRLCFTNLGIVPFASGLYAAILLFSTQAGVTAPLTNALFWFVLGWFTLVSLSTTVIAPLAHERAQKRAMESDRQAD